ncbi:MAG: TetR/AcrR family transcriptional regulator [Xanthomonadales bacterium]|jgi:AcrR family transcriptional regulator|nr:TetR/AcrR family transcriptional regulator [Xanthomonadales bacterium]
MLFGMVRQYNSSRRRKAAEQTRQDILQAALKLHAEGITEFEPLARQAGCSVATVRKHFPTKETLFQNCTRTFAETLTLPDLKQLAAIADARQRTEASVSELCRVHEAMFGYAWLGAQQRGNSPTLDSEMAAYEGLADAVAAIIAPADSARAALVRGLLDFLTYRALRLSGRLSEQEAASQLGATILTLTHFRSG